MPRQSSRSKGGPNPAARHKARHYAMQGLYQWQMSPLAPGDITRQFREEYDMTHVDRDYFEELVKQTARRAEDLDEVYGPYLSDRNLEELDPVSRALLRLATYELQERLDVPYRVVIQEAVSLARKFGATDSHKFINAVLDKVADNYRTAEKAAR